jgi:hypothetical protein
LKSYPALALPSLEKCGSKLTVYAFLIKDTKKILYFSIIKFLGLFLKAQVTIYGLTKRDLSKKVASIKARIVELEILAKRDPYKKNIKCIRNWLS